MPTFQITRHGLPIEEYAVINSIQTGIEFDSIPGHIPIFLEVNAAHTANYRYFHEWQELSPKQQAFIIAHYVANSYVEQHKADAEARSIKQRQNTTANK